MGVSRVDFRKVRVAVRRIVAVLVRMRHGGVVMRIQVQSNSKAFIIGLSRSERVKSEKTNDRFVTSSLCPWTTALGSGD